MRFELIGKTKATLTDIDIQSLKQGQTDLKPAVALTIKVPMANTSMDMLHKSLRTFFFGKASSAAKEVQATLDGIAPVSDLPALTEAAKWLGAQNWDEEQTGCTLVIYLGVSRIKLQDGTLQKLRFECKEGGAVEWRFVFYTSDVDAETIGELAVLKNHDLDIELTAPELISAKQANINAGEKVTPIKGAKGKGKGLGTDEDQAERQAKVLAQDPSQKGAWPFPNPDVVRGSPQTPEEALAGSAGAK